MKHLAITALLLAAPFPALAIETWQGDLFVTAATASCSSAGTSVNDFFRAVFRPRNLEDNGQDTRLSLIASRSAQRYFFQSRALIGAGPYQGDTITGTAAVDSWNGTFAAASIAPQQPLVTTPTVVVKVTLNTFANTANCTVTLQGSLGNRPNL
jgi:hypothetical protein